MERQEKLAAFMQQYDNVSFMGANVPRILENLKKADEDGCLREFLLNEKPYRSAFTFFVFNEGNQAARGKDQVAIVFALNLYGVTKPGFAARLNRIMKELAKGSSKQMECVTVLMRAQMQLQEMEISLINFVDRELIDLLNKKIKKIRTPKLLLMILFIFGGAIGMPGFTMIGLIPLTFVSIGVFIYGFMKIPYWLAVKPFDEKLVAASVRAVGESA